eukprot:jgi/Tetstr1/427065/TSEL_017270.t1
MESAMATAWGGGALITAPISNRAQSARTSRKERAFEVALVTMEKVADQHGGGKSTVEEKAVGGEAETERSFAIYRPGQLARQRNEEEDRKRAQIEAQRKANATAKEASLCRRNGKWEPSHGGQLRLYPFPLSPPIDVPPVNDRVVLFSATRMPHRVLPSSAAVQRCCFTCWLSNSDGGSNLTRMNASAVEPSTAEAAVKGAADVTYG